MLDSQTPQTRKNFLGSLTLNANDLSGKRAFDGNDRDSGAIAGLLSWLRTTPANKVRAFYKERVAIYPVACVQGGAGLDAGFTGEICTAHLPSGEVNFADAGAAVLPAGAGTLSGFGGMGAGVAGYVGFTNATNAKELSGEFNAKSVSVTPDDVLGIGGSWASGSNGVGVWLVGLTLSAGPQLDMTDYNTNTTIWSGH